MTFKTIEKELEPILEKDVESRADDMRLYIKYVKRNGADVGKVLTDREYRLRCGVASYDSISRIRRKLQAANASLRPTEEYIEARRAAEHEYRKYAKDKGVKA